jgi:hypothetical protein
MSAVPIVDDMTAEEALAVTEAIRGHLTDVWDLVVDAYTRRAWAALEYESWDEYCDGEFGDTRLRLPREERSELVHSLRHAGLSLRAIASATGHSVNTVQSDQAQVYQLDTPEGVPFVAG